MWRGNLRGVEFVGVGPARLGATDPVPLGPIAPALEANTMQMGPVRDAVTDAAGTWGGSRRTASGPPREHDRKPGFSLGNQHTAEKH